MTRLTRLFVIVTALFGAAAPLRAQNPPNVHRTFLDVQISPDLDDAYSESTRVPGVTLGTGISAGFESRASGIEVDVYVPQWHVNAGRPQRYQYVGQSFGYEQQGHFYQSVLTARRRSADVAVLHRSNVVLNDIVTVTWLAGGAYFYRPHESSSVTSEVLPNWQLVQVNTSHRTGTRNYLGAVGRLDVEVKLSHHWAVVPRLRVTAFPSWLDDSCCAPRPIVVRPEIAARWQF